VSNAHQRKSISRDKSDHSVELFEELFNFWLSGVVFYTLLHIWWSRSTNHFHCSSVSQNLWNKFSIKTDSSVYSCNR